MGSDDLDHKLVGQDEHRALWLRKRLGKARENRCYQASRPHDQKASRDNDAGSQGYHCKVVSTHIQ